MSAGGLQGEVSLAREAFVTPPSPKGNEAPPGDLSGVHG